MNGETNRERAHQDDETELTSRKQQVDPVLNLRNLDVVAGGDDTGLVQTAVELNDDLAGAVVINDLELADVACAVHQHVTRSPI